MKHCTCFQEAEGGALLIAAFMRIMQQLQASGAGEEAGEAEARLLAFCRRFLVSFAPKSDCSC